MLTNNWLKGLTKMGSMNNDIIALREWNQDHALETTYYSDDLNRLRIILGDMIQQANNISNTYRTGMRYPSSETALAAAQVMDDVFSMDRMGPILTQTSTLISKASQFMDEDHQLHMLSGMIHSMMAMRLSPEQQQQLQKLSTR